MAPLVIAVAMATALPAPATASPALRPCGTMHVRALRAAGYKSERLQVARSLSCTKGRRTVGSYYSSHGPCRGSGCFRLIGNLNCGGGQSSILGGVALSCARRDDPAAVVIELRVRPKPPPSSLETDGRTRTGWLAAVRRAASAWPTTVAFGGVGPEARVARFGVQQPGRLSTPRSR